MNGATHQAGALLAAGLYAQAVGLSPALTAVTAAGAFVAARGPDVDSSPESEDPKRRYDHRGYPHSLVFAGGGVLALALWAVALLGYPASDLARDLPLSAALVAVSEGPPAPLAGVVAVSFALGYLSHLLLDALTVKGIWLLSPGGRRLAFPLVRQGRVPEPLVSLLITLALLPVLVAPLLAAAVPW
ncbi:MAG: metal-dependent hydrolase [Actinomycetota bacterium]|nr:metal-dependent hydrolase [Actinomycetota bacterium]